ncbi:hypothetical protein Scep_028317 [Stephania cephalantha]|uniref:Uncharacterized protein n=1 Tax=Stephania cephalantha TaxID=152367 RepID=A0AAP0HND0_9MAGN
MLDDKQNRTSTDGGSSWRFANLFVGVAIVIMGIFGMNIKIALFEPHKHSSSRLSSVVLEDADFVLRCNFMWQERDFGVNAMAISAINQINIDSSIHIMI